MPIDKTLTNIIATKIATLINLTPALIVKHKNKVEAIVVAIRKVASVEQVIWKGLIYTTQPGVITENIARVLALLKAFQIVRILNLLNAPTFFLYTWLYLVKRKKDMKLTKTRR